MTKMWFKTLTISLWISCPLGNALAQAPDVEGEPIADAPAQKRTVEKPLVVELVESESNESSTSILIGLDRKPEWTEPLTIEEHGTFLQVVLKGSIIPTTGKFFEGSGPYLAKMAGFQLSPDDGAIRLFLTKEASIINKSLTQKIEGDKVYLTIDHKQLEGYGLSSHVQPEKIPGSPDVEDVVANTKVRDDIPDPANLVSSVGKDSEQEDGLSKRMVWTAIASGIVMILLASFHITRRLISSRLVGAPEKHASMKMLDSVHLAPKQKLTLMDVGGQQILLGVSPDGINYLTTVTPREKGQNPQLMARSGPSVDVERAAPAVRPALPKPEVQSAKTQVSSDVRAKKQTPTSIPQKEPVVRPENLVSNERKRISVRIDDEGVHQVRNPKVEKVSPDTLEDVTKLIRSKLKNIP